MNMRQLCLFTAGITVALPLVANAEPLRYIRGVADVGAQIVVVDEGTGAVMGFTTHPDGSYAAGPLESGRYTIYEQGPHHAQRHLTVGSEHDEVVDLAG